MTARTPSADEAILLSLASNEVAACRQLSESLAMPERSVRRRLRRLIRDGYVFAPERGRYRLTAAGVAVLAPRPELDREQLAHGLARFLGVAR